MIFVETVKKSFTSGPSSDSSIFGLISTLRKKLIDSAKNQTKILEKRKTVYESSPKTPESILRTLPVF